MNTQTQDTARSKLNRKKLVQKIASLNEDIEALVSYVDGC